MTEIRRRTFTLLLSAALLLSMDTASAQTPDSAAVPAPVISQSRSIVTVRSIPGRASVTVNGQFYGTTPLSDLQLPPGKHTMVLTLPEHKEKRFDFVVEQGTDRNFVIQMIPEFGFLTTAVSPSDALISIDGAEPVQGPFINRKIATGPHDLRISHPALQHTIDGTVIVGPGVLVTTDAPLDDFSLRAFEFSVLIPGAGQMTDDAIPKGILALALNGAAAYYAYQSHAHVVNSERYLDAQKVYYSLSYSEEQAIARRALLESSADGVTKAKNARVVAFATFGVTYLATLLDALVNHSLQKSLSIERMELVPMVNDVYRFPGTEMRVTIPLQ
jgi:hypothetical protein